MIRYSFLLAITFFLASAAPAQLAFERGDVVVSGYEPTYDSEGNVISIRAAIRLFGSNGVFKRELVASTERQFRDLFVRAGIVHVSTFPDAIERIDASGNRLAPFTTDLENPWYLAPAPDSGLFVNNISGELYQFAADGTRIRFRDFSQELPAIGGIDLAADRCTLFYTLGRGIVRWDVCRSTDLEWVVPHGVGGAAYALRILRDGTFLYAVVDDGYKPRRIDRAGNVIRDYSVPDADAIALHTDGTSFWTNRGDVLVRVSIDSGTILSRTPTGFLIVGITTVGEPRAAAVAGATIPTASSYALIALAIALAAAGSLLRMR